MYSQQVDIDTLIGRLTDAEKSRIPRAQLIALNDSAFAARAAWQDEARRVFDRPTSLTVNAVLVKKATPGNVQAEVYIRNEASRGTPPAVYLLPQVEGGARTQKPFEFLSKQKRPEQFAPFYVPGASVPRDQFGNISSSIIKQIQSQLQVAQRSTGYLANETITSKRRRLRRQKKKGIRGGNYFVLREPHGKLKPQTIYERIRTGFGSTVRTVLSPSDTAPTYRKRYDVLPLAQRVFRDEFRTRFARALRGLSR